MYTKQETLELLDYLLTAHKDNRLVTPEQEKTVSYRTNLKTICEINDSEMVYKTIGSLKNLTVDDNTEYQPFEDIYFREDCYDYLINAGFSTTEADRLTYLIRTGRYSFEKQQILKDMLSPDFFNWAVNVKYLASRIHFFKVFYREYEEYRYVNKYPFPRKGKELSDIDDVLTKYSACPETLYIDDIVKGKSSMPDEKGNHVVATDYLAKKLIETNLLDNIQPVEMPADKTYIVETHNGEITTSNENSNREEERTAIELFKHYHYDSGRPYFFADYQTPICRSTQVKTDENQHIGKIDLIYVSKYNQTIYLTEYKRYDNPESLLRCVTEIYTYYKQIDKLRLAQEIAKCTGIEFICDYKVVPAMLVYEGQLQHLQFRSNLFTNVQKLMHKLGIRFFIIHSDKKHNEEGFFEAKNNFGIYELSLTVMKPSVDYQKASLQKELDKAIMKKEKKTDSSLTSGYILGKRTFDEYLSNESFKDFLASMPEDIKIMYSIGAGSELEERKNKYGIIAYPPKMASFGSSSRMIYNLTKGITEFGFEIKLPTTVGGMAHLDGYTFTPEKHIYIEAKCREPYGEKTKSVGTKYKQFYEYLNKSSDAEITCDMTDFNYEKKTMNVTFRWRDTAIECFDMKQMLSHLLGIGTGLLNDELIYKPVKFLYLIYSPEQLEFESEEIKTAIRDTYYKTCNEAEAAVSKKLFRAVLCYLKENYFPETDADIDMLSNKFEFLICNQENFIEKLK